MDMYFYKGNENIFEKKTNSDADSNNEVKLRKIQDSFLKVLDNKNLSFLLGSGCSSYEIEIPIEVTDQTDEREEPSEIQDREKEQTKKWEQVGIPVMAPLTKEFYSLQSFKPFKEYLKTEFNLDIEDAKFANNLELFLSTLHSITFFLSKQPNPESNESLKKIESIVREARNFLLKKCLNQDNSKSTKEKSSNDAPLLDLYKEFYRKLLTRNSTLPRLNIFTTNYDLYSERAMDDLGIHYVNGFTGGIQKFFNPAIFNYALAEKMDLSQSKWSVIDNFFYLYKLHGSVNWIENNTDNKLFKVKEIQDPTFDKLKDEETIMIHPTPLKYNVSLGSPYSDLFREFQRKLMSNNNILVTIGYSFSDEHINNLIFQAFTIPSFRLIVIGEPKEGSEIEKLKNLNDSRIWIIGGKDDDNNKIHYFENLVKYAMPDLTAEDLDKKMEQTIRNLKELLG